MAAGADPNAQGGGGFGGTPLHVAVSHGDAAGVEALVAAGADVMARDGLGWTPLHHAASLAEVAILLAAGADVMARSRYDGRTPLHGAVTETVEALLAAGGRRDGAGSERHDPAATARRTFVVATAVALVPRCL